MAWKTGLSEWEAEHVLTWKVNTSSREFAKKANGKKESEIEKWNGVHYNSGYYTVL